MQRYSYLIILILFGSALQAQENITKADSTRFYGKDNFLIEGTVIPESDKESPYDRLPASYKDKVRKPVWDLSKNSAGISVRFFSDSPFITARWEVLNNTTMNHMAETGIKGVDLYCKVNGVWQYVNTGRPSAKENEIKLVNNLSRERREYRLYLPLYDGTSKLEIGVDRSSSFEKPVAPKELPIVFYGTSITQGGCASRPGMVHTSIISRKLGVDIVNLGFSGNGKMEAPVVEVMAGMGASFYVIDCLPNMTAAEVTANVIPLARMLREKNPNTPIVFIENLMYAKSFFEDGMNRMLNEKNQALKTEYEKLLKQGMKRLIYIDSEGATGIDNEGSVDGVHLTDLGFSRFADFLIRKFEENGLVIK
jgi:hypothetical protein